MDDELLFQIALTQVPQIGFVQARILVQHLGTASAIFKASTTTLEKIEGIGEVRARSIRQFSNFGSAKKEIAFLEKYQVTPLFMNDAAYPQRLLHCYDFPVLLYYKGNADLNTSKIIAIVGTRSNTDYGRQFTEKLIKELSAHQVIITSGLAFGIDAIAHKASMKNKLPTIGVVGHGLDQMYPPQHAALAKEMVKEGGGILTEFRSGIKPDKHNFPGRNRIVAGISDATVVIETGIKGGSLITADLANSYNRDVFALPGKVTDQKSMGCNQLIQSNKAILLSDAKQLIEALGWEEKERVQRVPQRRLFIELSGNEKCVVNMLNEKNVMHIDELNMLTGLSNSAIASAILNLELQNVIQSLPGKLYKLIG
jgi:DNA processing protein